MIHAMALYKWHQNGSHTNVLLALSLTLWVHTRVMHAYLRYISCLKDTDTRELTKSFFLF